jgi:hypothetical protein
MKTDDVELLSDLIAVSSPEGVLDGIPEYKLYVRCDHETGFQGKKFLKSQPGS